MGKTNYCHIFCNTFLEMVASTSLHLMVIRMMMIISTTIKNNTIDFEMKTFNQCCNLISYI